MIVSSFKGIWAVRFDPFSFDGLLLTVVLGCSPPRTESSSSKALALLFPFLTFILACWSSGCRRPSLVRKRSQVASFAASVRVMYYAFVDDRATVDCLFEHQLTGPPLSIKTNPEVDLRLSLSPAQSESEYPSTSSLSSPLYVIPRLIDPLR